LSPEPERSEEPSSLPPPELNPLLNPLLAQNMGRWAQVYFTSPAEKREEAVHELLRELRAENSMRAATETAAASADTPSSIAPPSITEPASKSVSPHDFQEPEVQPALIRCHACGRKNPSTQRFCGLCGTRLGEDGAVAELHRNDLHHEDIQSTHFPLENQHIQNPPPVEPASFVRSYESQFVPPVYRPRASTNELSLFQRGRDLDYTDEDPEASRGSYRTYGALILVILVGVLAYLAWRNAQLSRQTSHSNPPASFAAPEEPVSSEPVPENPSKTDTSNRAPSAEKGAGPARKVAEPASEKPGRAEPVRKAALRTTAKPEKNPQAQPPSAGNGAEELAVAQGYLSGTNGQRRNSAEAAKWLWKAVAKHNAGATFLLSDLYLKGDGVSKNCDQARVLLDAAALKGMKGAGERLRHLQAFGCQ
jgi:hypothetical protein